MTLHSITKRAGSGFWGLIAFGGHTIFLASVVLVDRYFTTFTLRSLHEYIVDRHAFEGWWWLQNRFPHQLGTILFPLAEWFGLETASSIFWFVWYLTVGAVPYVLVAVFTGWLLRFRSA